MLCAPSDRYNSSRLANRREEGTGAWHGPPPGPRPRSRHPQGLTSTPPEALTSPAGGACQEFVSAVGVSSLVMIMTRFSGLVVQATGSYSASPEKWVMIRWATTDALKHADVAITLRKELSDLLNRSPSAVWAAPRWVATFTSARRALRPRLCPARAPTARSEGLSDRTHGSSNDRVCPSLLRTRCSQQRCLATSFTGANLDLRPPCAYCTSLLIDLRCRTEGPPGVSARLKSRPLVRSPLEAGWPAAPAAAAQSAARGSRGQLRPPSPGRSDPWPAQDPRCGWRPRSRSTG